ncbi:hypothetical protein VSU01S_29790 [Vibrio superstes NBRC 103154]|uniref:Uncharacterized protein n=1 Tax=Vibrio superstes NBRC 103154 TaxID=1219062 RepID=A0A511QTR4_9VIBR|nr:hypothetical protein VSU01S_29790 [Vibrio superstes NBRC 103154]
MEEAAISSNESTTDANKLTEPVTHHTAIFTISKTVATIVADHAAMVTNFLYSCFIIFNEKGLRELYTEIAVMGAFTTKEESRLVNDEMVTKNAKTLR